MAQENDHRIKLNENFIHSALKVENNMQNALANVKKMYLEREKRMEDKIQQVIEN